MSCTYYVYYHEELKTISYRINCQLELLMISCFVLTNLRIKIRVKLMVILFFIKLYAFSRSQRKAESRLSARSKVLRRIGAST